MNKKLRRGLIEAVPLAAGLIIAWFVIIILTKNEFILALIILLITAITFKIRYHKNEIWLPLFYGYGFVIIRRIGNMIVKG